MTATNHFLIGVSISLVVKQPLLALPLAFISHLAADALPHFGGKLPLSTLRNVWIFDAVILSFALLATWKYLGFFSVLTGFASTSPDLVWVYKFVFQEKLGQLPPKPKTGFNYLHATIQKYEFIKNWPLEFVYAGLFSLFIFKLYS